jgi:maleylacetate reductase
MEAFTHELMSGRVVFGDGALGRVAAEVDRLGGRRVLLIGTAGSAAVEAVAAGLGDTVAARIGRVVQHVPAPVAANAVEVAKAAGADLVVTVGGGSAIGLAKAVARELGLPVLAVPTTYSGSEMTPIWGVTEGGRKTTGRDPRVLPRTVVYDPRTTLSMPPRLTATSGMNALAHCVEALYAPARSPVIALVAVEGAHALAAELPICVRDGADVYARGQALYGAWLAGLALGNATMGLHHEICHILGGTYGLPHAEVHAAVLPYATAFNAGAAPAAMAVLAAALGTGAEAAAGLWDLARSIGAPTDLVTVGFPPEAAGEAAAIVAAAAPVNPRPVTEEGVRELLRAACAGERPDPPA